MKKSITYFSVFLILFISTGCGKKDNASEATGIGTIVFTANGEDFVRQGFVDRNGWDISFKNVFINIENPKAYMPGDDSLSAILKGPRLVDLAEGDDDAPPIIINKLENMKAGNYQALKFKLKRIDSGKYKGYSIVMIGTAKKAGKKVDFTIRLDEELNFDGKDGYVGDEIKGMLTDKGTTEVEMTFHFDHIFGDKDSPSDSHINAASVGFDFFNQFAKGNRVDIAQADMKMGKGYRKFVSAIWTLGHLGEGHCNVSNQSSRDL